MMNPRFQAVLEAIKRTPVKIAAPVDSNGKLLPINKYFGENVFTIELLKDTISKQKYEEIVEHMKLSKPITQELAKHIADAVKEWAMSKGATHFCHWFQPQTGLTAEKHDSFLAFDEKGHAIESFNAEQLVKGEPDASSFPSGGMRSTFEARGYTAWDPTSPMFISERTNGKTLCIPSVFISYTGEVLDEKTPLLRSLDALNKHGAILLKKLGYANVQTVTATLGCEQEYFLVDLSLAKLRPDLLLTGRSLIGAKPSKGQELEDNYFGSIPSRVHAYINDVEVQLYKLGVPAKTRHNEVAPGQYEIAPIFRDAALAADQNQLTMQIMTKTAEKHGFYLLLHEKPFLGVNGNGKHNNWSMRDNLGNNLLEPGKTPHENTRFLSVLSCVVKAVYKHAGLLRATIASAANDRRLGANEAPPAIISIYLGKGLLDIVHKIINGESLPENHQEAMISLKVGQLPAISKDDTDRNRTSPFAFTGNKFEFRAVGGSQSVSFPIAALNTAVADVFEEFANQLNSKNVIETIRQNFKEATPIFYEGDNYDPKWKEEAVSRGLKNLPTTPEALQELITPETIQLFTRQSVLNAIETRSKYRVRLERYIKTLLIESDMLKELIDTVVIPTAIEQSNSFSKFNGKNPLAQKLQTNLEQLFTLREKLDSTLDKISKEHDEESKALLLKNEWIPLESQLREKTDAIEGLVDDKTWTLPKARELLHIH